MRWVLLVSALVVAMLAVVAQAQFGFRGGAFNGFFRSVNSGFRSMFHPVMNMFSPPSRPFTPNVQNPMQFSIPNTSFFCRSLPQIQHASFLFPDIELQLK